MTSTSVLKSTPLQNAATTRPATTEATTPSSARDAVFRTQELVENIILHLPARSIFALQRVAKSFRNATQHSLPIQEKLLLRLRSSRKPCPPVQRILAWGLFHRALVLNPLFAPGTSYDVRSSRWQALALRHSTERRHGVDLAWRRAVPASASVLDTYLFGAPALRMRVQLSVGVGEGGFPGVYFERHLRFERAVTVRTMIEAAMEMEGAVLVAEGGLAGVLPREIVEGFQAAAAEGEREVYFALGDKSTFSFPDAVFPGPEDWAALEAGHVEAKPAKEKKSVVVDEEDDVIFLYERSK